MEKHGIARRLARLGLGMLLAAGVGGAAFAAFAWHPALPVRDTAGAPSFSAGLVKHGAALAALGDCAGCHSLPGRPAYSGGVPLETPFGTLYSSNITPDRETGLGLWSEAAFRRAMREGLDREGRHLYPAFPYTHYTRVSDDDLAALYAFVMTRPAVHAEAPANALRFPFNIRPLLAGWKLLFFRPGPEAGVAADPVRARGAYLVDGLAHCGGCHTPRNLLGAETGDALGGGVAEGWNAYALNEKSPAPLPWTVEAMAFYLGHGWHADHGVARGPMAVVTANLARVPADDLTAMATVLVDGMGAQSTARRERADAMRMATPALRPAMVAGSQAAIVPPGKKDAGAAIVAAACQPCHDGSRPVPFGGLRFPLSSALHAPDPTNVVTVTLHGLSAPPGDAGSIMPGFAGALDDDALIAMLRYLRETVAGEPPWPDLPATVRRARTQAVTLYPSDGVSSAPAANVRVAP